jgi:hypothetical protein
MPCSYALAYTCPPHACTCCPQNSNLVSWMNLLKGGVSATTVWTAAALMILVFRSEADPVKAKKWADSITVLMLAGQAPAFGAGALISWAVLRYKTRSALKALE